MPRRDSRANGSASPVFRPVQTPSEDTKTATTASAYAEVPEQCVNLWLTIITDVVAIQREHNRRYAGRLFDSEISYDINTARFRSRMSMLERINTLFTSAQTGLQFALGMKVYLETRSRTSRWESAKKQLPPWMREAVEIYSRHMLKRNPVSISEDHEQHLSEVSPSDELLSRANEVAEMALQSCTEQIASIQTMLSEIEKQFAGTVFREGLSERANTECLRSRLTMTKRVIGTLLSAQQGLQAAFAAKMNFEQKSATPDWKTAKAQKEIRMREQWEKIWLVVSERSQVFGVPFPEIHEGIDYGAHSARVSALFNFSKVSDGAVK